MAITVDSYFTIAGSIPALTSLLAPIIIPDYMRGFNNFTCWCFCNLYCMNFFMLFFISGYGIIYKYF